MVESTDTKIESILPPVEEVDIESWTEEECLAFMKAYSEYLQECASALVEAKKLKEQLSKIDNVTE